jgi:hypothetical protein
VLCIDIDADLAGRGGDKEGWLLERRLFADEAQFAQTSRHAVALADPPIADKQLGWVNFAFRTPGSFVFASELLDFLPDTLRARPAALVVPFPTIAEHDHTRELAVLRRQCPCGRGKLFILPVLDDR